MKRGGSPQPGAARKRGSGGKRPGAGRKPSPLAEPITVELKGTIGATAREFAAEAIAALVRVIRDPRARPSSLNAAAKHLLDAAKVAEDTEAAADTRECTDMDLARWMLSVLESAADQADREAGEAQAAAAEDGEEDAPTRRTAI